MSEEAARQRRARARATYPGRVGGMELLGSSLDLSSTPSERVAQVYAATLIGWELSGHPMPTYSRADAPGTIRRCQPRADV
ncbi:MAG: hypothetical protein ACE37F_29410 [Nannocystaceae bacterium]|nr:hypothetical protein [bacterium]